MSVLSRDSDTLNALPFYVFISLLLSYLGGSAVWTVWLAGERGLAILASVMLLVHIGLYWMNTLQTDRGRSWWIFYYPAQTILMVGIVLLLQERSDDVLSFIFSSTICIVGEGLGVWGNSRRSFMLGIFYISLLVGLLFVFSERQQFYSSIAGLLVNGGAIILFMVVLNQQLIERQKAAELAESLEAANTKLAASAARIESLTLQNERQRMARELHDTLAQGVAGLVLQLEAVKAHLTSDRRERAASIVDQALLRARSTLSESRAAIDDLRAAPGSLPDAVRQEVDHFKQSTGIGCELELAVRESQLTIESTNHALHILREALTNIVRHAQATNVRVIFLIDRQSLALEIRDNGKGFDMDRFPAGHYGLVGMQERARLAGGTLAIDSAPDGTCIRFIMGRPS
jgi:NarL family two-component system sensor histidine kinase YdfH